MKHTQRSVCRPSLLQRMGPGALTFLATLAALPVNAGITLPTDPLTTASRVPPNILFILDDSGSMEWRYMYNPDISRISGGGISSSATGDNTSNDNDYESDSTSLNAVYDQNYVTNTLYYNPSISYQPWVDSAGNPLSGGTTYDAAYSSAIYVTNTAAATTSSTTNLAGSTRTFYVPKAGATNLADATQYYRYQILTNGRIVRSERLEAETTTTRTTGTLATNAGASSGNYAPGNNSSYQLAVPAGASNLTFSTSGGSSCSGSNRCADLYVRRGSNPSTSNTNGGCSSTNRGNTESCTVASPQQDTYYVRVYAQNTFSNLTVSYGYDTTTLSNTGESSVGCDTSTSGWGWRNCTYATPTGRGEEAERNNFATWYSYHRTRTKAAKAGAGMAFSELGNDVRVGFRTIWGRNGSNTTNNSPTQAVPIPVNYNQGLFADPNGAAGNNNNRARWYNRLYGATASSGTPLRSALNNAGIYFSQEDSAGPYGPETGAGQLQCRQNFTILTTDGYWNNDATFSSGGDQDSTNGEAIARPDRSTYTYTAARPYQDGVSNTLADVAMRYWKNDLRTDMSNIVPTTSANPAFWQHMVTFGISIGLKGTLNPQTDLARLTAGSASWPTPTANSLSTIDDLWHASVNGHGRFLTAANPTEFTAGLRAALATVTERTGSFSNVAANSAALDSGTLLFQANYVSGVWTGELLAYARSGTGDNFLATPTWRASTGIPTSERKVFTSDGSTGLVFPDDATAAQLAALERTGGASNYPVTGANNAAYLAGDRSRELSQTNGTLRNRNHLLGDIVSSSPAYVQETNTLYVGANDGMLHAINAADGRELFAFIPNGINWSNLATLSRPDYTHRYFVDGPIVVSNRKQTPDQSILAGTLGKGGKGIFALDVTSPAEFGTANFKWEVNADNDVSTTTDNNLGLVQGKPIIAKLNNGETALVVANGLNSTNGRAVLLIYNLDTGALIRQIDTGVGSSVTDDPNSNGLSAPVGWDRDGNGTIDYIYSGDRLGNLWKFDLSTATTSTWGVANSGNPLFTAVGPDGTTRQPITGTPTVALHPTKYTTWVFFGTGSFMTTGDVTSRAVQSLYGIMDTNTAVTKSQLTQRNLVVAGTSGGRPVRAFQANSALPTTSKGWYVDLLEPPSPGSAVGERVVTSAQMAGSALIVSSIIPTADACQSDGRGYLNALDAFTGTSTGKPFFDVDRNGSFTNDTLDSTVTGTPENPNPPPEQLPIGSVDLGVGMLTLSTLFTGSSKGEACAGGSAGNANCVPTDDLRNVGRVSWREVIRN